MRVHIQRGAYLAVSHIRGYRNHIYALEYQQTCVQVPQRVDIMKGDMQVSGAVRTSSALR